MATHHQKGLKCRKCRKCKNPVIAPLVQKVRPPVGAALALHTTPHRVSVRGYCTMRNHETITPDTEKEAMLL